MLNIRVVLARKVRTVFSACSCPPDEPRECNGVGGLGIQSRGRYQPRAIVVRTKVTRPNFTFSAKSNSAGFPVQFNKRIANFRLATKELRLVAGRPRLPGATQAGCQSAFKLLGSCG